MERVSLETPKGSEAGSGREIHVPARMDLMLSNVQKLMGWIRARFQECMWWLIIEWNGSGSAKEGRVLARVECRSRYDRS